MNEGELRTFASRKVIWTQTHDVVCLRSALPPCKPSSWKSTNGRKIIEIDEALKVDPFGPGDIQANNFAVD